MKKLITNIIVVSGILILNLHPVNHLFAQKSGNEKKPIPQEVLDITKKSCDKCHAEPAKGLPISLINFSKWENLSAKKQASKSKAICNEVTKSKMPPKKFLEKNPEAALSKEEIQIICDWAKSLQLVKK